MGGLLLGDVLLTSPWGLGSIFWARVGGNSAEYGAARINASGGGTGENEGMPAFVTEVRLPKSLDTRQLKRLNNSLRTITAGSDDVARPYGAVPAQSPHGAAVWVAWSDSSRAFRPLMEALRSEPGRCPKWRMAAAQRICASLVALHGAGKSHGSFSPRSILVDDTGDVCLLEAGLVDSLLEGEVLSEPDLLATLGLEFARYLAPEGWQVPRCAGATTDVWSLGLILIEVLAGVDPPNSDCTNMQQLSAKMLPKRGRFSPMQTLSSQGRHREGESAELLSSAL